MMIEQRKAKVEQVRAALILAAKAKMLVTHGDLGDAIGCSPPGATASP